MHDRARVLGVAIDRLGLDATIAACDAYITSGGPAQQTSVNAAKIVAMRHDARLREAVERADIVSADGQAVVWASRVLGDPLPERVAGIDLMFALLRLAEDRGYRVFVLGAKAEVLERAAAKLRRRYPRLALAGYHHGYFTDGENAAIATEIRTAKPHILFVAMSSPRKELWQEAYATRLGIPLAMGVGGAIDVVAEVTRRAPPWLQRLGLEWAFRLAQEPRRLARRYVTTNTQFALLVASELARRGRARL